MSDILCSSPVTEDVPPRRDRSIHGVPPSVTGLVHSRSVPLHPTSVTGLVHSRSIHTKCYLHSTPWCNYNYTMLCWHGIWPGGLRPPLASPASTSLACPHRPRLPPWRRGGPGSDARHWFPDVILGFAEYALSFPTYICLSFSLSLLFRQSLLYDSQFNISIRTRLISTCSIS